MTTYVTRSPLQLLSNPHMMSEPRRSSRRLSARQPEKDDPPIANGIGHGTERVKGGQSSGVGGKQGKASANGASTSAKGGRGKRKIVYDEESDGFTFKRAKAEPKVESIEERPEPEPEPRAVPVKKTRRRSPIPPSKEPADEEKAEKSRRRSARHSGERNTVSPPPLQPKKRRVKDKEPGDQRPRERDISTAAHDHEETQEKTDPPNGSPRVERCTETTKVSLPFADTPVIRRNQEMRKGSGDGQRRSSLGMRGRRASSLIDSGKSNALPHEEVDSSEFYKHIEANGLSEPRRMRQLLTWCGTRALGEKPSFSSADSHARLAAREIQQQLLKDFSSKSELSDWFSRKDSPPPPQPPQPNPKNTSNLAKIQELEQQIARLQTERQTWESLLRPPTSTPFSPLSPAIPTPSSIDPKILASDSQTGVLTALRSFTSTTPSESTPMITTNKTSPAESPQITSLQTAASERLSTLTSSLEFEIDKFASNVHTLEVYKGAAERVADGVLGLSAQALEEREREGARRANGGGEGEDGMSEGVGMRGVLRGLSRVLER